MRPSDGMIFFISGTAGNDSVFRWDPAVPATAPVFLGRTGTAVAWLPRLAFSASSALYAINTTTTQLYTINQTTGAATATGAPLTGVGSGSGDIAFAPNGTLYMIVSKKLYTVPLGGGAITLIGPLGGIAGSDVTGLAFDASGRLLASNDVTPAVVYVVPLTAGGATALGSAGFDLGDLGSFLAVDLRITKTHAGSFSQGQTGATYTITVRDSGNVATSGTVTVLDTLPAGLTPVSASGTGWTCPAPVGQVVTCTRSDALASGGAYPVITLTVNVSGTAPATVTNTAWVSGGGEPPGNPALTGNDAAADVTAITAQPELTITKTHTGNFTVGVNGVYTLTVTNSGRAATAGTITVTDNLPAGLTFVSGTGAGSTCSAAGQLVTCTSATSIAASGGTSAITLTVGVGAAAAPSVTNSASVSGGGEPAGNAGNNTSAGDVTAVDPTADLSVTKTDGLTAVDQGATLTYTIVASNAGPSAVVGATVSDVFPAQLSAATWTCAASAGSSCPASGSGNLNAVVDLLSGGTATFTATGTVTAGSGTITNTATVTAPAGTNDPAGNNSATDNNTVITPTADLSITKTDGLTAVNQGGTVIYTIVASNAGPSAVVGATVTDNFPAQLSGVTWTCAASAGSSCPASGSGNIGASVNLLSGGSATFTVTATASGAGTITNTATVTAPAGTNDPAGNNSATDNNTVITPTADLAITKTDGLTGVNQGATLTYTIVASNAGPSAVVGATVSDVFPAQLSAVTWTCAASAGSSCPASGSGNLNAVVDLLSGGTATFTATGTVTAGSGTITNTATVTAPGGVNDPAGNNSATDNNTVITPTADLSITKTDGLTGVNQGATLTYTIVASNAGPSAVVGATVSDVFPAQLTSPTWTCVASAGSACPASGSGNLSALVDLLSGGTATFTATGTVTAGSGTITNTASVTAPAGTNDPAGNNSATDNNTVITPTADLSITKTDGMTSVNQGGTLTYTIGVSNAGPSAVVGATVTDVFPAQLSSVTWTCAASAGSSCPASGSGNIGASVNLLSGGSATFTVTATAGGAGTITNTATVTAPAGTNDPAGNNLATDNNTVITPTADLGITKASSGAVPGQSVTYTIAASNAGPTDVTGATVVDVFPAALTGMTWTCAASAGASCPASGAGDINATVNILAGGTVTFTATGALPSSATGTLTNTATVTAPGGLNDPPGNNSATVSEVLGATADVQVTKSGPGLPVVPGTNLVYTVVVTNTGPSDAATVSVADPTPTGLTFVSNSGDCVSAYPCALGTLVAGASRTITTTYNVPGAYTTPDPIVNTATATSTTADPASGNNTAVASTSVAAPVADLGVTKTDGSGTAVPGTAISYTIVASNAGPSTATGATVTDNFPPEITGVTWTCVAAGGAACPASGAGNLAALVDLPSGGTATFVTTGTIAASATGTLVNTVALTPPAGVSDPTSANNTDVDTLVPSADLGLTKTGPAGATPGATVVYTLVVSNAGPSNAASVAVSDPTPAGLTFVSTSGDCVTAFPCTLGTLAPGATRTITATYAVPSTYTTPDPIVNTATVTSPTGDPAAGNNTASTSATVARTADLSITKTDGLTAVNQGGPLTYTIVASNAGPSAVVGATVSDNFPAQLSGVTWTCAASAGSSCPASGSGNVSAVVDLLSAGTATFTVTATASGTGTISNTATVTAPAGVNDAAGNNSATDNDTQITATADLAITKTDGVTAVNQGASLTYTIGVSNAGPSAVVGATVSDVFPAQLSGVTWTCAASAGSSCPASGSGNLNASVNLLAGGTATFTATATVIGTGTISNTATVTAPAGTNDPAGNNSATDNDTQVTASADLSITKTDGLTGVNQGATLTYTIVATNAGPSAVTGATVSDVFPAQLSGVTWTCVASVGSSCPASGSGNLNANIDLLVGGTATFTATATVTGTGTITNTATVTAPAGTVDAPGNNSATDNNTVITPTADLAITKTDGVTSVNEGATLTYTIVASNAGPSAVTGATVSDAFPAQLSGVTWTCAASAGSSCPASGSGNLNASVNLLATGAATFTATGTVTANSGTITNTATVTAPAGVNDPAGNNSATDNDTQILPTADLAITKTDGVTTAPLGGPLTYTIVASNAGPSPVTGATVTDNFPAEVSGMTWTCAASAGSSCPASGSGNLNASVNLLAGGTATFTATGTVAGGASPIVNTATVTAPAGVNDPAGNNSASDNDTQITPGADLAITKTDGVTSVNQGATLTYTIVVSNAGPDAAATGATVSDVFPAQLSGITWTCAASAGSSCPASGSGNVNASVNLLVGGTATFTATGTVTASSGTITNTASVTAPAGLNDPPGNNSATDNDTQIAPTADLAITKTDGVTAVNQGATLTYAIVASNAGPNAVTGATVSDVFPAQLSGVTWTCAASAGSSCPASGSGNLNASVDLLVGGTATFTATGTVTASSGTITNTASVTAPAGANDPAGNNAATDNDTQIGPTADLAITKTDGVTAVSQGATLTYTIVASNAGPSAVTGATVTDNFPAQLGGVTWTCAASAGSSCPASGSGNLNASVDLLVGGTVTFTATATVTGTGTITNVTTVTAPAGVNDPAGNNSATDNDTQITATADLAITKTDGVTSVNQGASLTYSIVASNAGPSVVTGATVSDVFPAQLSGVTWTCAASAGSSCPASGSGNVSAAVNLLAGGTATFTATATVTGTGTITNVATVTAPAGVNDPAGNNSATDNTTALSPGDLALAKSHSGNFMVGTNGAYTLTVTNVGTGATSGVITVADTLPAGLTFVSASGAGWTCAAVAQAVTCTNPGPLAPAASSAITLSVSVAPAAAPGVTNVASVSTSGDANAANNLASDPTTVDQVDLSVAKSHTGTFVVGGTGLYTITVTNVGTAATTGSIDVTDTLPAGLTFISGSGFGGTCAPAGQVVTCTTPGPLAPTASAAATLTVGVGSQAYPSVTNAASVSTPGDTGSGGNNRAVDAATLVIVAYGLSVEKKADREVVEIADALRYDVIVRATGDSAVAGVRVNDALPAGFSYIAGSARLDGVAISDPAGAPGPRLSFAVGTIPAGGSVTLSYRLRIGAGALQGDGVNRAQAVSDSVSVVSNMAVARVRIEGGVFTDRGIIVGKVFVDCDCNVRGHLGQDREELGVPGVRVYLEDGTSTVTDVEGKYNFYGVSPRLHVVKVDWTSLPPGAELMVVGNRNAADPVSRFVDLKNGELHKADFAVRRTAEVLAAVKARRAQGEVFGVARDSVVGAVTAVAEGAAASYQPVLPPQTLTAANSGVPIVPLRDSLAPRTSEQTGRVELVVPRAPLPADGTTPTLIGVRVLDARGTVIPLRSRVTLEASLGRWLVKDLDLTEPGVQAELAAGHGAFLLLSAPQAGAGQLRATVGGLSRTEPILFVPASRPLLVVGVVQARASMRSLTQGALTPARAEDGFEERLNDLAIHSDDGNATAAARGALYLRGKIQGKYLLALSFDSERDGAKRLFRDIQPEEFYPVYGDASIKEFDAQSAGAFYVRVDHERSFVLYGDYVTPAGGETRMLSAYNRTQTGVHQHIETARASLDMFASRGRLTQVIDEIPGLGISGPYALRRTDGRLNTETVEILTRDRNQPSLILRTEPQRRFVDYTLEPFTGRLLFRAPVPSRDANLNPVSIRVTYEVDGGGEAFWNYGLVARTRLLNGLELGGTATREENPLDRRNLFGVNSTLRFGTGTYLLGEFAQSDDSAGRGRAGRLELRHHSRRFDARLFGTRSDAAFFNPSSTFGAGRGEYGMRAAFTLDRHTRILGEALRTENITLGGRRDGALLTLERRFGDRIVAEVGYRHAEETTAPADSATVGATPNRTSAIRGRLSLQLLDRQRASVFGEFEQDILEARQRRATIGGEYMVARRARLYARHELISSFAGPYALNGAQRLGTTVVGLDASYLGNQLFSEYRARDAFSGREAEAAIGLRNRWPVSPGFVVNTSFERVQSILGGGQEATSVTGALEYTRNPLWRGTARLELRAAPSGDNWLGTLGYARKVTRDVTFLGRALVNTVGREQTRARSQLGLAVRQTDVDTWNGFARYEYRYERLAPAGDMTTRTGMHVFSAQLNVQPSRTHTVSARYAGKIGSDVVGGASTPLSAHLFGARGLVDLSARWDVALIGNFLGSDGFRSHQYGLGAEVGRRLATNLRMAVGYNLFGFRDDDLSGVSATTRGLYLDIGMKFDEGLFGAYRRAPAPAHE